MVAQESKSVEKYQDVQLFLEKTCILDGGGSQGGIHSKDLFN
jgi:hypothetical protein